MLYLAILEIILTTILSANVFTLYQFNNNEIENTINQYNKNNIIYYTKTYWPWNWNYCLNWKTFNFVNNCDYNLFKNNRMYLVYVETNNNKLYYKKLNNKNDIKETSLK